MALNLVGEIFTRVYEVIADFKVKRFLRTVLQKFWDDNFASKEAVFKMLKL